MFVQKTVQIDQNKGKGDFFWNSVEKNNDDTVSYIAYDRGRRIIE